MEPFVVRGRASCKSFRQYGRRGSALPARHAGARRERPRVRSQACHRVPTTTWTGCTVATIVARRSPNRPGCCRPTARCGPTVRTPRPPARPLRRARSSSRPAGNRHRPTGSRHRAVPGRSPPRRRRVRREHRPGVRAAHRPAAVRRAGQAEASGPPVPHRAGRRARGGAGLADRRPRVRLESDRPGGRRPGRGPPRQPARHHVPAGRLGLPRGSDQGRAEEAGHRQHGRSADGHDHDLVHPTEREAGADLDPPRLLRAHPRQRHATRSTPRTPSADPSCWSRRSSRTPGCGSTPTPRSASVASST